MPRLHGFEDRFVVDTSERDPVYLLTTPDGRYLRFSASAFHLLQMMESGMTAAEVAEHFGRGSSREVTAEEIEAAHARLMERVRELDKAVDASPLGLRFARRLIPAEVVRKVSGWLVGAFDGVPLYLLLALVVFSTTLHVGALGSLSMAGLLPYFWSGYALFWISLVAHEFGHAAACARFGARPADIGIGVWFIYPALYSDVTDAWRLSRWERVIVDVGGIYFQAVVGAVFVLLFEATGWRALQVASLLVAANCLFSLNPIFKLDGYWIISDALGVTNLRTDARRIVTILWSWLRGRATRELPWSRGVAVVILVSGTLATAAWAYFMVKVVPMLWTRIVAYPGLAAGFGRDLLWHRDQMNVSRGLSFLLASVLVLLGLRMIYDLSRRTVAQGTKASRAGVRWVRAATARPAPAAPENP
jgi:putative peptide zinc metalloprotease protein